MIHFSRKSISIMLCPCPVEDYYSKTLDFGGSSIWQHLLKVTWRVRCYAVAYHHEIYFFSMRDFCRLRRNSFFVLQLFGGKTDAYL
ncbi:hypothetical protein SETIT_9G560900v2 [Setaria italica]|uniref:Uncharacterized protein n=2 Tax=Setaria TaxID=4554 RepID=A0A368SWJ8_SETIT|nr:hypothetical protein SETIT_9G560900v2 [Setaria italica]TKV98515.1 hypothetical protein SEVIR_9G565000v2 [Setaria viridis]